MARRQDGVSAPETRAGRMATSARMTLGQGSIASDAESYQRGLWRRPDPRITAGLVATACALLPIRFRPRDGFGRARRPLTGRGMPPWPRVAHVVIRKRKSTDGPTQRVAGSHVVATPLRTQNSTSSSCCFIGAPDTIRTCDLCLRRATLYPAELRVREGSFSRLAGQGQRPFRGRKTPVWGGARPWWGDFLADQPSILSEGCPTAGDAGRGGVAGRHP